MSNVDFDKDRASDADSKTLKERLKRNSAEVKDRAADALHSSAEMAKSSLNETVGRAKAVASDALGQVKNKVGENQHAGAEFVIKFAANMREAAKVFEGDVPMAASGIMAAADYINNAGERLRDGAPSDMIDSITDFARRHPAAFLGMSVLAGFAVVRFLRAPGASSDKIVGDPS